MKSHYQAKLKEPHKAASVAEPNLFYADYVKLPSRPTNPHNNVDDAIARAEVGLADSSARLEVAIAAAERQGLEVDWDAFVSDLTEAKAGVTFLNRDPIAKQDVMDLLRKHEG
ncbi:hypothetical protein JCM19239_6816 [Vibrio variabilis]|uniref:Uncharacterized protein n=1 Tax=Vibrio variabilis TaxID=990271 RepID=A0ABQ0JN67_9VIBR|nr:hypothetical protein JCM19239_6816 [Vibrio variabilis]